MNDFLIKSITNFNGEKYEIIMDETEFVSFEYLTKEQIAVNVSKKTKIPLNEIWGEYKDEVDKTYVEIKNNEGNREAHCIDNDPESSRSYAKWFFTPAEWRDLQINSILDETLVY